MIHKPILIGSVFLMLMLFLFACKGSSETTMPPQNDTKETKNIKILALGDSYTKGESIAQKSSFPYQLKAKLESDNSFKVTQLKVVAETGWSTSNLSSALNVEPIKDTFDLVTLLIGVNNQFRKIPIQDFETEFLDLLQRAIGYAGNDKSKVVVLSIPDYGATPFGAGSAALIGKDIDRYNSVKKSIANLVGVTYINITPISRKGAEDNSLVASDGLHPSAKMYTLWVEEMLQEVRQKLNN